MGDKQYRMFEEIQQKRGIDCIAAKESIKNFTIETPSWGYGDSGTRFHVFKKVGVPRTIFEKLEDAALVHQLTGIAPAVAIHIPWDKVDDYHRLREHTESLGIRIGSVNPNLFQDDDYMFGSLCNSMASVRRKAVQHLNECVDITRTIRSDIISLWLPDGTNYPGQADIRQRKYWLEETLAEVYSLMDANMRLLIEYKFFEPSFYHTDLADWGMAYVLAQKLGKQAEVLVDMGHHSHGINIEHIVAFLIDEERLGGFHFNARKYADDDLMVATINPYELFLVFYQILSSKRTPLKPGIVNTVNRIAYMIDQSHNIEPKIPAMIRSVMNVQTLYAKALLINWEELADAQQRQDVLGAEAAVREAFEQDVSPLLKAVREEMGVPVNPLRAFIESGYAQSILSRGKHGMSW